ncbi:ABC transporter substrate-binding protein [Mesorhizobium sp.]|uniref:ABC transporter substrate-binding protein n=1 Tax=Mesorhizobium sp. TaxID=1871066 RepID=UPI000FE57643|nr:ABC transporter substrate-binding protein [Mesorhizobium sp.]RWB69998.1 MAG: ABC transporter substrate-binding protein [Mesorhizobium sp.]
MDYKPLAKLLLASSFSIFSLAAMADDLTVVDYGGAFQDAQRKVFYEPFKAESKVNLKVESWDGGLGVIRSRAASADPGWDLVDVETADIVLGCEEGLFEELDYSKIAPKDTFIPGATKDCGVAVIVYNEGIAYDKDKLKDPPTGWADFFDLKKFPGKRALRMTPIVSLPGALIADGVKPEDVYKVLATEEGVDRAFKKLDTIKKDLIFWKAGAQPPQLLASGEVVMTTSYNGRVDAANRNDKRNFGFVWNGSMQTFDYWAIMKGSPRKDAAYKFLQFYNRPEVQAKFPDEIAYGVPRKEASGLIDPKRLADIPSSPDHVSVSVPPNDQFWPDHIDKLTERLQAWAAQ